MVKRVVERRLGLDDTNPLKQLLTDYLYHTLHDNGSGEYALNKILEPGVWARKPLYKRISVLKQYQDDVNNEHENVDANDQMDDEKNDNNGSTQPVINNRTQYQRPNIPGFQVDNDSESEIDTAVVLQEFKENEPKINSNLKIDFIYGATNDWMKLENAEKIKKKEKIKCDIYTVKNAGHQLILENPKDFANVLATIIIKGQKQNQKQKFNLHNLAL